MRIAIERTDGPFLLDRRRGRRAWRRPGGERDCASSSASPGAAPPATGSGPASGWRSWPSTPRRRAATHGSRTDPAAGPGSSSGCPSRSACESRVRRRGDRWPRAGDRLDGGRGVRRSAASGELQRDRQRRPRRARSRPRRHVDDDIDHHDRRRRRCVSPTESGRPRRRSPPSRSSSTSSTGPAAPTSRSTLTADFASEPGGRRRSRRVRRRTGVGHRHCSIVPPTADHVRRRVGAGVVTVDLDAGTVRGWHPTPDQRLAIAQIVLTLTTTARVGQVQFTLDGEPTRRCRGATACSPNPASRVTRRLRSRCCRRRAPTTSTTSDRRRPPETPPSTTPSRRAAPSLDRRSVTQALHPVRAALPVLVDLHPQLQVHARRQLGAPSSPTCLRIWPPLPITMPFWLSRSTMISTVIRGPPTRSPGGDRVRQLVTRDGQQLLAHQLGDPLLLGQVAARRRRGIAAGPPAAGRRGGRRGRRVPSPVFAETGK